MRIGVIGSMHFTEKMLELRDCLAALGHDAFVTTLAAPFVGKSDEEKERIKITQKMHLDAIREFWRLMQGADAMLVANFEKNGVPNYIGANTFLEIGFAHVLGQNVYLLHAPPENSYIATELAAMRPIVLDGDLARLAVKEKINLHEG
ncbi:hypothetical protein HY633_04470 [Candidatus Uhrbacteria bacterium]|nr:hypothetical protein [Candidatus Uhrbacteria bacterium]